MPRRSSWCWRCCGNQRDPPAGECSGVLVHVAVRHAAKLRRASRVGYRRDGLGCILCLADGRVRFVIPIVPVDRNSLPKDPEILQQMLVDLTTQLDKTQRLLRQLLAAKSGTHSEQLSADQLRLFVQELNAPESEAATDTQKDEDVPPGSTSNSSEDQNESRRRGRRNLPAHLKRERIEHDLAEEEKHCACCSQDLRPMGEETSERYEYIPAQLLVIEDVCKKYACACTMKTAGKPAQPIEKSVAGASLLAQVIVSKIADTCPCTGKRKSSAASA
jgi:transposase IS66-like protein/transposase IS166 family protein